MIQLWVLIPLGSIFDKWEWKWTFFLVSEYWFEPVGATMVPPVGLDLSGLGPVISPPSPAPSTSTMSSTTLQSPDRRNVSQLLLPDPYPSPQMVGENQNENDNYESDSDSGSDYLSFQGSDYGEETKEELEARERERRMVLEAAGLILQVDERVKPPVELVRARSKRSGKSKSREVSEGTVGPDSWEGDEEEGKENRKRRPAPAIPAPLHPSSTAAPRRVADPAASGSSVAPGTGNTIDDPSVAIVVDSEDSRTPMPQRRRPKRTISSDATSMKDLPPIPPREPEDVNGSMPSSPANRGFDPDEHAKRLDDAFERYESFKNANLSGNYGNNRLSVVSATSTDTSSLYPPSSPTTTVASMTPASSRELEKGSSAHHHRSLSNLSSHFHGFLGGHASSQEKGEEQSAGMPNTGGSSRYGQILQFLSMGRAKTPETENVGRKFTISGPIAMGSAMSGEGERMLGGEESPAFGSSWASLVDRTALEGIPASERKRQEAIFELINTEVAYVRDLQLIVEVFYSSMLELLSRKEITVIFANIEDILLTNTAFVSSLEERQKECRLYIDRIGDILLKHIPSMSVYLEYCVNQSIAIKVLKSLRDAKPELASHLQRLRDSEPSVRNLDLSSYLLAPMQRITRYPLLIKQILQYTEAGEEHQAIKSSQGIAERLLDHINETIREQEGRAKLKKISENLWIGQGRLDLTAPTRHMGNRKLLKEGPLIKTKSGRKIYAFLCSDILVMTDEAMKTLYRMVSSFVDIHDPRLTFKLKSRYLSRALR
ncbi:hypothetical protein D9756_008898 [Leucocoprinus leucothites]|uniref:DH domain-containing protein n=1 Tax=Leucocoprinus leucothites TaxID=201217 RepID=A0A8H5D030_9AGAR|nr:hypothetical protein D9756_008898 [Leucoagaricus leucothites]